MDYSHRMRFCIEKHKKQAVEWDKMQSWDLISASFNSSTAFHLWDTTQDASAMDKHIH